MPRTKTEARPSLDVPSSHELLEGLLTIPGSTGDTYRRFHNYSPRNIGFLALQGCPPEPVATFKKWQDIGRHVQKGEKAFSILRPIQVKIESEEPDEPAKVMRRFKVVRALFAASQTAGDDLPRYEREDWSIDRALSTLEIERVPFRSFEANMGGYAVERTVAINPVAPFPLRTTLHEMSHVQHGHTTPENLASYQAHRGTYEFEAEASAYVVLKELDELDEQVANVSRSYVQTWLRDQKPSDQSMRQVLNVATTLLNAGFAVAAPEE